jgi:hypothetical protein
MKFRLMFCTAVFSLLAATSLQAAPITVPTSLNPGDQYRLAFVTSGTRDATSPFIADYNDFVQDHADAVPELLSLATTWNAIASTLDGGVARDNTGTNPDGGPGVPIFLLDDTRLAENNNDLWDGSIAQMFCIDENGSSQLVDFDLVWTGSLSDGSSSALVFGTGAPVVGSCLGTGAGWVADTFVDHAAHLPLYGISEILTVVPEPSSFILLGVAIMGVIVGYPSRARRRHRN